MAGGAAELLETGSLVFLVRAAVGFLYLNNGVHRSKQSDASLEALADLLAALGEA